jgi:hypothetical protein
MEKWIYGDMQACTHADMQTCRHADMHTYTHAHKQNADTDMEIWSPQTVNGKQSPEFSLIRKRLLIVHWEVY